MAILLQDYANTFKQKYFDIKVFATDADTHAITFAGAGLYAESITSDVPKEYLDRYFVKEGNCYRIIREIRQKVIFAPQDIINNAPFSRIDLATCRNVLIYFKAQVQDHVLKKIAYSLAPSGFLFLGSSESLGEVSKLFTSINPTHKLFQYQSTNMPEVVPTFPQHPDVYAPRLAQNFRETPKKPKRSQSNAACATMLVSVFGDYLPDCIIIDKDSHVLYSFGDTSLFMHIPSGQVDMHLTSLTIPPIQTTLSTAVHQAQQSREKVVYKDLSVVHNNQTIKFDLIVHPFMLQENNECCLIIFNDGKRDAIKEGDVISNVDIDKQTIRRIQDLENKLEFTEETLQATIEELETSNEELQATNEELRAANEELHSTNDELHSTNEELVTINNEYHVKIREMSSLNDDMENILRCSEISTIFLDKELHIRRFSATSQNFVQLKDADIGRPFSHFSHLTGDINLLDLANRVLTTNTQIDRELKTESQKSFLVRVYPYISHIDLCEGVVITFVDITALKDSAQQLETAIHERSAAREALRQTEEQLAKLAEIRKSSIIYCRRLSGEKNFTYISSNVSELFGYTSNQFLSDPSFWVDCIHPEDSSRAIAYFEKHFPKTGATPLEFRFKCYDGTYKWLRDETKLIIDDERKSKESLGSWIDITLEKSNSS
ncbi:MAG: PAS domain-containing protein [Rhodothermaceae bacterium]|nr:PAS domain-containing protein [Rhodothermaceae bacterium]